MLNQIQSLHRFVMSILANLLFLLLVSAPAMDAQVQRPGPDSPWVLAPAFFPAGALANFVEGDPHRVMPVRVDFAFPEGYRMPAHVHAQDIHVRVQQGALAVGTGKSIDPKRTRLLQAGDSITVPGGTPHYWIARGNETVISVTGMGPFLFTYVDPGQDPSRYKPFGR